MVEVWVVVQPVGKGAIVAIWVNVSSFSVALHKELRCKVKLSAITKY
jgi:hypothetical protein